MGGPYDPVTLMSQQAVLSMLVRHIMMMKWKISWLNQLTWNGVLSAKSLPHVRYLPIWRLSNMTIETDRNGGSLDRKKIAQNDSRRHRPRR